MIKRIFLLVIFITPHFILAMDCLKSIADRHPKIAGFVAGTVITASMLEAYHLWCAQKSAEQNIPISMPLNTRNLIVSCRHNSRQESQPQEPSDIREHTECHDFRIMQVYHLHYKNSLSGTTEIFEEDREDIRIILKKMYVAWRGIPKHEMYFATGGKLTVKLNDDYTTLSSNINCTIILPRKRNYVPIQIAGQDNYNKELILYRNDLELS